MKPLTLVSFLIVLSAPIECPAQAGGAPNQGAAGRQPGEAVLTRDTLSQSDLKRLAEQIDQWNRVEGDRGLPPREAKARTSAMLGALKVSCVVSEATYRGTASEDPELKIYEAACEDGAGYLLLVHRSTLSGISCLATGSDSPVKCAMPPNADSRAMAGRILSHRDVDCTVRDVKWLGTSAADLDHVEVACESGSGYMMRSPRIGSSGKLEVVDCQDAIKQGVACELSSSGAASGRAADSRPSLEWFKEALSRNGVNCQTKRARIVGRESIKRRYLVEFECADHPEGLITFVPPVGDTVNSFESMSCAEAAQRGIRCEWVPAEGASSSSSLRP
jgi:hypothetical protein